MAKRFTAQVATFREDECYDSADLNVRELAAHLLPHLSGGDLFAYLFHRFGYPDLGWDSSKTLVNYCLTTPMLGVFLLVRPYMGGDYTESNRSRLMFGHYVERSIQEEDYTCLRQGGHTAWPKHPRYKGWSRRSRPRCTTCCARCTCETC